MRTVLSGRCLCGGVRFEIAGALGEARYCHCSRCQRRTGTGSSVQASLRAEDLRLLEGDDLVRWYWPPDGYGKAFCHRCGSALFSRSREDPERMSVRLGVIDGDPGVRPALRQHVASAATWEAVPDDGLPRFDGSRPPGPLRPDSPE